MSEGSSSSSSARHLLRRRPWHPISSRENLPVFTSLQTNESRKMPRTVKPEALFGNVASQHGVLPLEAIHSLASSVRFISASRSLKLKELALRHASARSLNVPEKVVEKNSPLIPSLSQIAAFMPPLQKGEKVVCE